MCTRYCLTSPPEAVRAYFGYKNAAEFPPRYNIAPSQPVAIVRTSARGGREFTLVRWGFVPGWIKDPREFKMLVSANSETAAGKPSFRAAMRHRRCLVPADGFYEWTGRSGARRPHLVRPRSRGPMALAAIYEDWLGADGSEIETMAILTTTANRVMAPIHGRMPVIIPPEHFDAWLDCSRGSSAGLEEFLRPAPDDLLEVIEVSSKLNDPRNEGPEVQEPAHGPMLLL